MKKYIVILIIIFYLCGMFSGCDYSTSSETPTPDTSPSPTATSDPITTPSHNTENNGSDKEEDNWQKGMFRPIYYDMNEFFIILVGEEVYNEWYPTRYQGEYGSECIAVTFIRDFNIPREDFERANEETRVYREENDLIDSPNYELYPVDLIYTCEYESEINEYLLWPNGPYEYMEELEISTVTLRTPAEEVLAILGEPLEKKTTTEENLHDDTLLDYYYIWVYENFELEFMTVVNTDGPEQDTIFKEFGVIRVTTTDENYPTARGIRVGDSVEKMFTMYGLREVESSGYFYYEVNYYGGEVIRFAYEDGKITEISFYVIFD